MSPHPLALLLVLGCSIRSPSSAFETAPGAPFPVEGGAANVALGDLDGDGRLDVVSAASEADTVSVLLGR